MKKKFLIYAIFSVGALMLNSCGGGGGGSAYNPPSSGNINQPVVENPQPPVELGNTIYSVNGTAKLVFKDGVVIDNLNSAALYTQANNLGNKTVVVPHTGTSSVQLQINDNDSNKVYVLGEVNGNPLTSHPFFGINNNTGSVQNISGYDPVVNKNLNNYPAVVVSIVNGQGTLDWKFQDTTGNSEGQSFTVSNYRLANVINQGNNNYIDVGDYFPTYVLQFNALPSLSIVGTNNCPVNKVDTDNDGKIDRLEIPPNIDNLTGNCIAFSFSNSDNISYNAQYSTDGTNYNPITFGNTYTQSFNVGQGQSTTLTLKVKEFIDQAQTISDSKSFSFTVYRDKDKRLTGDSSLTATCSDATTGNSWTVGDGGICNFADPGTNTTAGTIRVQGSSATYGNCVVEVYKNLDFTTPVLSVNTPCNNIDITYNIPESDKGAGQIPMDFIVFKIYENGSQSRYKDIIDSITIVYSVNQAPTTNP